MMKGKRIFSAAGAAAVLLGTVSVLPVQMTVYAEPTELFSDDFEDGNSCGWASHGGAATVSLTTDQAHSGKSSMFITDREQDWQGAECSKVGKFYAGETYSCSIWFYYDDASANEQQSFQLGYKYVQNGETKYSSVGQVNAEKGEWSEMKADVTFPEGVTGITLYTQCSDTDLPYYIDDCTATGEPHEGSDAEGFSYDFEDGKVGDWYGRSCDVKISEKMAHSGDYSIYTSNRSELWMSPAVDCTLYCKPGGYYSFSCWVAYDGENWTDTAAFQSYLMYNLGGETQYMNLADEMTARGEWVQISTRYTIPEGATNIAFYVQPKWSSNPSDQDLRMDFYLDDVECKALADPEIEKDIPNLKDTYEKQFKLGCAATVSEITPQAAQDIVLKHFNSLTLGNELKPEALLDAKKMQASGSETDVSVNLQGADKLLTFAKENHLPVRGHTLVWHSQTPDWFFRKGYKEGGEWASRETMLKRMENYIKAVFAQLNSQYPDVDFYCWDVVNEAFLDDGSYRKPGSTEENEAYSPWIKTIGEDYITYAFRYAREYAPERTKLFYNDFNEYTPAKRDAIIKMVKGLQEEELIDGIGMQSHLQMSSPTPDSYAEALKKYGALGLEIHVTELDINTKDGSRSGQLELAQRYRDIMNTILSAKKDGVNVTAVVIWGITDSTSWIGGYPVLFDEDYHAKPSFYAVQDPSQNIQTVKNKDAISAGKEQGFDLQAPAKIGDKGTFKAVYDNEGNLVISVTSAAAADLKIMLDGKEVASKSMTAGQTYEAKIPVTEHKIGTQYSFDIALGDTAWNSLDGKLSAENCGTLTIAAEPVCGEAASGAPVIDGKIDDIWQNAKELKIDNFTMGKKGTNAQGTARVLWDSKNLYVLVEVTDPNGTNASSGNHWECDTVEVFFDQNNEKTASYQNDDIQCRVGYDNSKSVSDNRSVDDFTSAAAKTSSGYLVEIAIPAVNGTLKSGQTVGFDIQINDDAGTGERAGSVIWSGDKSGMGYTDTRCFGVLKLTGQSSANLGDVNLDGDVDVSDAVLLARYVAEDSGANIQAQGKINADVDGVTGLTGDDVIQILKYIAKIIKTF
ncbi:MAG: endo-1,4-beta-xylanase [Oscillospiraceae bacterium]|nr:endo-1,4-beta-xylanase [Oscillospiraceae bacterium]